MLRTESSLNSLTFMQIEVDLAVLWEEVHETDDESEARKLAQAVMADIEAQVKLWEKAGGKASSEESS